MQGYGDEEAHDREQTGRSGIVPVLNREWFEQAEIREDDYAAKSK